MASHVAICWLFEKSVNCGLSAAEWATVGPLVNTLLSGETDPLSTAAWANMQDEVELALQPPGSPTPGDPGYPTRGLFPSMLPGDRLGVADVEAAWVAAGSPGAPAPAPAAGTTAPTGPGRIKRAVRAVGRGLAAPFRSRRWRFSVPALTATAAIVAVVMFWGLPWNWGAAPAAAVPAAAPAPHVPSPAVASATAAVKEAVAAIDRVVGSSATAAPVTP